MDDSQYRRCVGNMRSLMRSLTNRITYGAENFDPTGLPLAVARSTLAAACLINLAFSPDYQLFTSTPQFPDGMRCGGAGSLSLWCLTRGSGNGALLARAITLAILTATMSGYRPRWTGLLQWYATFSLTASMTLPSGGDNANRVATLLLLPMTLGDTRTWQWARPDRPPSPAYRGSSYAAWLALRAQIAVIYFDAAVSKLAVAGWRDGHAMTAVFTDPHFGLPAGLRNAILAAAGSAPLREILTWTVLGVETAIVVSAVFKRPAHRTAVILAALLHGGIMLAMGLICFGATMIALDVCLLIGSGRKAVRPMPAALPNPVSSTISAST